MSNFLTINGLNIAVAREGAHFERTESDIQTFDRSEGFAYQGALYAQKRQWTFEIPYLTSNYEYEAQRGWVKGRGSYWNFNRPDGTTTRFNKYPTDGGVGFDANIVSSTSTRFVLASHVWSARVTGGLTSTVTVPFGNDGRYTMSLWKLTNNSTTFVLCSAAYDGTTTRFYAGTDGQTITTSFSWAGLSAASGYLAVSLKGFDTTGASFGGAVYDNVMVVPYAMTTSQLAARNARTLDEPGFPYVELGGDCLEDLNPKVVKGFMQTTAYDQVSSGGLAQMPKIQLVER